MSCLRTGLVLGLIIALGACASIRPRWLRGSEGLKSNPKPVYPRSEREREHEGWVLLPTPLPAAVSSRMCESGRSSGNPAFEAAATSAVGRWRYRPGEVRDLTTLVTFTIDGSPIRISIGFMNANALAHEFIDIGRLEAAETLLAEMRNKPFLTPYELAYSYLAEERIAFERKKQLLALRMAMLDKGTWLADDATRVPATAVALEIEVGDFASALRDYNLLVATPEGRQLTADLDRHIEVVRVQLQDDDPGARAVPGRRQWHCGPGKRGPGAAIRAGEAPIRSMCRLAALLRRARHHPRRRRRHHRVAAAGTPIIKPPPGRSSIRCRPGWQQWA